MNDYPLGIKPERGQDMFDQVQAILSLHSDEIKTLEQVYELCVGIPQTIREAMLVTSMIDSIVAEGIGEGDAQTH